MVRLIVETPMRILIAYDGSEHADAALDDLALAGLPPDAEALVLSVLDAWLPEESAPGGKADEALPALHEIRGAVNARLEAQRGIAREGAAKLAALFPNWRVSADTCVDTPVGAIIRRAEGGEGGVGVWGGKPADLVVVGSRGHGLVKRALLGSVARQVMHGLRCSLRICRGPRRSLKPDTPAVADASPPGPPRVLVGTDGSSDSRAAVEAVSNRRWPIGTHILIATYGQGIAGLEHSLAAGMTGFAVWGGDSPEQAAPSDSRLSRIAAEAFGVVRGRCPGVSVSTVVRLANPRYALIDEAANWKPDGADCIFVGARGVRGFDRLLLGSVSSGVAMEAPCSVEIVHPRR